MDTGHACSPIVKHPSAAEISGKCGADDENAGLFPLLPRVYVISETRLFREGLNAMLSREGRLDVIGQGSCANALQEIGMLAPELVLLDMAGHNSLAVPRQLRVVLPALRIVAVALAELDADVIACAEAGICGYVPQDGNVEDLIATMMRSLSGELICTPRITALLFDRVATLSSGRPPNPSFEALTRREREIAGLIGRGLQNKEIARRLCLSNATIKNHVHNILQKLQIQRRSEIFGQRFDVDPRRGDDAAMQSGRHQRSA
jgi:DNA-binding NarL/FixJ family response regulator